MNPDAEDKAARRWRRLCRFARKTRLTFKQAAWLFYLAHGYDPPVHRLSLRDGDEYRRVKDIPKERLRMSKPVLFPGILAEHMR